MYAILGNRAATDHANGKWLDRDGNVLEGGYDDEPDGDGVRWEPAYLSSKERTEIGPFPDDVTPLQALKMIADPGGIWANHAKAGEKPAWVASDNAKLAEYLADEYGCEIREPLPAGEKDEHESRGWVATVLGQSLIAQLMLTVALLIGLVGLFLRTNAGTDWQSDLMGSAAGTPAKYMALSATSGESAAHTSLAGEITTASGGLIRKAATYAHTTGTSTYTLTATFTANGSDSLPVTVKQCALFNASSSGTMAFEKTITDTLFASSGDAATITYTVTP